MRLQVHRAARCTWSRALCLALPVRPAGEGVGGRRARSGDSYCLLDADALRPAGALCLLGTLDGDVQPGAQGEQLFAL